MKSIKTKADKFIITQEQIDEVIQNIENRFLLKAKSILKEKLIPFEENLK